MTKWHQEFLFGAAKEDSKIELKLYDWNRFSSSKSLGTATISLAEVAVNTTVDQWWSVGAQGELRVIIHVLPALLAVPAKINMKIDSLRLVLERTCYWPGEVVRGVVVFGVRKPTKIHSLRLLFEGITRTSFIKGADKNAPYIAAMPIINTTALLAGTALEKGETFEMAPGGYLYPFEYCLPLNISHTYDYDSAGSDYLRYRFAAHADIAGKSNKTCFAGIYVRWHPSQTRPEPTLPCKDPITKTTDVRADITGPATAFSGENYTAKVIINNQSNKPITALSIELQSAFWHCARSNWGTPSRLVNDYTSFHTYRWDSSTLSSLPIAPNASFSEEFTLTLPGNTLPSLHSTRSPLIQNGYRFLIKVFSDSNSEVKVFGNTSAPVLMGEHYSSPADAAPAQPMNGSPASFILIPPSSLPPNASHWIVPGRTSDNMDVAWSSVNIIQPTPSSLPGHFTPPQTFDLSSVFQSTEHYPSTARPPIHEWSPGTVPVWISSRDGKKGEEGVEPANPQILAAFYR